MVTAVSVVQVGPNRVLQVKTQESDGYNAVQLGFDDQKEQRLTKALVGHFKKFGATPTKRVKEFRDFTLPVKPGDVVGATMFAVGDYIDAIGVTKGRSPCQIGPFTDEKSTECPAPPANYGVLGPLRRARPGWPMCGCPIPR